MKRRLPLIKSLPCILVVIGVGIAATFSLHHIKLAHHLEGRTQALALLGSCPIQDTETVGFPKGYLVYREMIEEMR
jgi:hypothetical protein